MRICDLKQTTLSAVLSTGVPIKRVYFTENILPLHWDKHNWALYMDVHIKQVSIERGSTVQTSV